MINYYKEEDTMKKKTTAAAIIGIALSICGGVTLFSLFGDITFDFSKTEKIPLNPNGETIREGEIAADKGKKEYVTTPEQSGTYNFSIEDVSSQEPATSPESQLTALEIFDSEGNSLGETQINDEQISVDLTAGEKYLIVATVNEKEKNNVAFSLNIAASEPEILKLSGDDSYRNISNEEDETASDEEEHITRFSYTTSESGLHNIRVDNEDVRISIYEKNGDDGDEYEENEENLIEGYFTNETCKLENNKAYLITVESTGNENWTLYTDAPNPSRSLNKSKTYSSTLAKGQEDCYTYIAPCDGIYRFEASFPDSNETTNISLEIDDDGEYMDSADEAMNLELKSNKKYELIVTSSSDDPVNYKLRLYPQQPEQRISEGVISDSIAFKGQTKMYVFIPTETAEYDFILSNRTNDGDTSLKISVVDRTDDTDDYLYVEYDALKEHIFEAGHEYLIFISASEEFDNIKYDFEIMQSQKDQQTNTLAD